MSRGGNGYQEVIERLTSEMREGAHKAESLSSACIYRVPRELRKLNESAYTPCLIAIGPLHRKKPHLQTPMQHVKMSYMNNLFCRITEEMENQEAEQKKILQDCVAAMEKSIEDAKKCYAEEVTLDAEMMLVDGCFILEFLYRYNFGFNSEGADPIFDNSSTCIAVQRDLVLLENQIPFLVLERLFSLTLARIPNNPGEGLSLTDYVYLPQVEYRMRPMEGQSSSEEVSSDKEDSTNTGSPKTSCWPRDCIRWVSGNKMNNSKPQEKVPSEDSNNSGSAKTSCWPRDCILWVSGNKMNNSKPEEEVSIRNGYNYHHILHKIHDDLLPHDQTRKGRFAYMPSASELLYAGVKFLPGKGNHLFKVNFIEPEGPFRWFRSARFEIPFLTIADSTEPYLRNFIALEQCCPSSSKHFTSYALLMDTLVNSDIDVQVLEKAGVIHKRLGASEDVTNLFNNLTKGIVEEFFFSDQCNRATKYSKRFWPKNMAYLRRQYFASPWKFIAFCLGFVYLGLTIAQLIVSTYLY